MLHTEDKRVVNDQKMIKFAALFHLFTPLCTRCTPVKERFILSTSNIQLII